jgi:hypothetical protein
VMADVFVEVQNLFMEKGASLKYVPSVCIDSVPNEAAQRIESTMWQEQNLCGYLSITTDSSTQMRKNVVVNEWLSNVWGMHMEELLARFASHDLHLHCPALDMLYHMTDELVHFQQNRVRYIRLFGSLNGSRRGMILVCSFSKKSFDTVGRHSRVRRCSQTSNSNIHAAHQAPVT